MPIREALQKLVGIKALTVVSGRSIGIPRLTADRLKDLTRVRIELEGALGEWATENVTPSDLSRIRTFLDEASQATLAGDVRRFLRSNREFHFAIYKLANSETAYQIIETLWLQVTPYFHNLYHLDKYCQANAQHAAIFNALCDQDAKKVRSGIVEDIMSGSKLLLSTMEK
jgi:DNA-binding GntR family transcriptional regulator